MRRMNLNDNTLHTIKVEDIKVGSDLSSSDLSKLHMLLQKYRFCFASFRRDWMRF